MGIGAVERGKPGAIKVPKAFLEVKISFIRVDARNSYSRSWQLGLFWKSQSSVFLKRCGSRPPGIYIVEIYEKTRLGPAGAYY